MTIKLAEAVAGDGHTLTATGVGGSGKSYLLDKISDACANWHFRATARGCSGARETLSLKAARRAPSSIINLIELSAPAWGFKVVPPPAGNARPKRVLHLERRDQGGSHAAV